LDLVADAVGPKSKVSDTLFSLNEKQPAQVDTTVNNLLSSLADLATDKLLRSHIGRAFRKSRDASKPRAFFADIVETTIQISKSKRVVENRRLYETCRRVLANCLDVLPTADLAKSSELLLANPDSQVQVAAIKAMEVRAESVTQNDQLSVTSLLSFLPKINELLGRTLDVDVKNTAISCVDSIVERFGKKDAAAVSDIARTISGPQSLKSKDDYTRILSLLCLTSIVDVLEDEAISLLPTVLPTAFDYLKQSIEGQNDGLHNAVFSLLSNIVERLSYMFSRDYMVTALELVQQSACGELSEECDESRQHFMGKAASHLDAREVFTAVKATWTLAVSQGYEAVHEQLGLIQSTIENQPKSSMIKASSALFSVLLDAFNIRQAIISAEDDAAALHEDEIQQLESSLIDSILAMTLKLNDTTFRPFFIQLVDFASSSHERSTTLCKFLAAFFDRFKSIVTSYASYTIELLSSLLTHLAKHEALVEEGLRTAVLEALKKAFEHDQDGFWQAPSHYGAILKPLLQQLTIDAPLAITNNVIPAITELAAASSSSMDNHREMNAILLKYMRSEDSHTRLATVKCEQSLTKRLGEEWLSLLPEMLPFISELREDDDEMVERETQRWITMVEEILGEDLEGMLQ
jgi:U3 small nucleolar RNA-associated protein 10